MKKNKLTEEEIEKLRLKHLEPHDLTQILKVGDIVSVRKDCYLHEQWWKVFTGKVIEFHLWEDDGLLTVENHGILDIQITEIVPREGRIEYLKVGDVENFVYHKWYEKFEKVDL